jgi:spermidine synthase
VLFEELDFRKTALGELSLRRREEPRVANTVVYEVKLGEEFLMSSLFTVGERALASLGLAAAAETDADRKLDVVVGGLGLGYTAAEALDDSSVASLIVIDALGEVIEWHRQGLVPLGHSIANDKRCRLLCGDFFALASDPETGFDPEQIGRRFDAVLLDIDHSPSHWLAPGNAGFYSTEGLRRLCEQLHPGGVFAMWSNDRPDEGFIALLGKAFTAVTAELVTFANPYSGGESFCTVYVARRPR